MFIRLLRTFHPDKLSFLAKMRRTHGTKNCPNIGVNSLGIRGRGIVKQVVYLALGTVHIKSSSDPVIVAFVEYEQDVAKFCLLLEQRTQGLEFSLFRGRRKVEWRGRKIPVLGAGRDCSKKIVHGDIVQPAVAERARGL